MFFKRGELARVPVYRFTCGHIGRTAERSAGFIRVAAIRDAPLDDVNHPCPDCK